MKKIAPWKIVSLVILGYVYIGGLLGEVPRQHILNESIRNVYFHVPMWFTMIALFGISVYFSIQYLRKPDEELDDKISALVNTGIVFGILGCLTGSLWASVTWGSLWPNDPKTNATAISMLIYFAYLILRNSIPDELQRAKVSAIYNIFAFALLIPLIFVLPRLSEIDSLHPGNGGNPAFGQYDMNNKMRMIFYPSVIGWIMLGYWISQLAARIRGLERKAEQLA
jgi:heme exporter protein C